MKGVQCYELFGGIALKNNASFGGGNCFIPSLNVESYALIKFMDLS